MNGAITTSDTGFVSVVCRVLLLGAMSALGGCVTDSTKMFTPPPPYMSLPSDEMMSCDAIAASFQFAARRAARIEYWMSVGPLHGYGFEGFPTDAPAELSSERGRLDALTDLQRYRGCTVFDPAAAVVYERSKLENSAIRPKPPVVLNSKG